jgi:hypothetical protein
MTDELTPFLTAGDIIIEDFTDSLGHREKGFLIISSAKFGNL